MEFRSGDKVIVKRTGSYFDDEVWGRAGIVIGVIRDNVLVKFEEFVGGHSGFSYYKTKDLPCDENDHSHWWVMSRYLIKIC